MDKYPPKLEFQKQWPTKNTPKKIKKNIIKETRTIKINHNAFAR